MRFPGSHAQEQDQCRRLIAACDSEFGWSLDSLTIERYVLALTPLLVELEADVQREVVLNYHQDHQIVLALSDRHHPDHAAGWTRWSTQALGVLRRAGLDWSHDQALADEDLVQEALIDLARALPSFRYQSRFSSWAFSVVVRSARRQIRFANAQRRAGRPDMLSLLPSDQAPVDPVPYHEHAALAQILAAQIAVALGEHPDGRLRQIFQLWAMDDRTSAEIGALVHLHESRVRALLKLARSVLREHPDIRAWAEAAHLGDENADRGGSQAHSVG